MSSCPYAGGGGPGLSSNVVRINLTKASPEPVALDIYRPEDVY
jgi:hypothetical protein